MLSVSSIWVLDVDLVLDLFARLILEEGVTIIGEFGACVIGHENCCVWNGNKKVVERRLEVTHQPNVFHHRSRVMSTCSSL